MSTVLVRPDLTNVLNRLSVATDLNIFIAVYIFSCICIIHLCNLDITLSTHSEMVTLYRDSELGQVWLR